MNEYIWRRVFGIDSAETTLAVVFLIILFTIAIWQPQRIGRPRLFRVACVLFALTILVPAISEVVFRIAILDSSPPSNRGERDHFGVPFLVSSAFTLIGRIGFAISIVCALCSLDIPRRKVDDS